MNLFIRTSPRQDADTHDTWRRWEKGNGRRQSRGAARSRLAAHRHYPSPLAACCSLEAVCARGALGPSIPPPPLTINGEALLSKDEEKRQHHKKELHIIIPRCNSSIAIVRS